MKLNHILNDKNAQISPEKGKAVAHIYMPSRAEACKRRTTGINHVFISLLPEKRKNQTKPNKQKRKRLSSNHERRKEAEQVNFHAVLFTLDAYLSRK